MERKAEHIIYRRTHTTTLREYAERKRRVSAIIYARNNRSNLSFLRGVIHKMKLQDI